MSKIIKSSQIKLTPEKFLLPLPSNVDQYLHEDSADPLEDVPIKYVEEPADQEEPLVRPTAEELRQQAKKEVEDITRKARQEAEKIKEEARKEAQAIGKKIEKEAREKGRQQGLEEGRAEGVKAWENLLGEMEREFVELSQRTEKWKEDFPGQVIDLSLEIASRILSQKLEEKPEIIVARVQETLQELAHVGNVLIKVSTQDYPLLEEAREHLAGSNGGLHQVNLMSSNELEPGDFLVETEFGGVDGRVETQLELLQEELKKGWRKNGRT